MAIATLSAAAGRGKAKPVVFRQGHCCGHLCSGRVPWVTRGRPKAIFLKDFCYSTFVPQQLWADDNEVCSYSVPRFSGIVVEPVGPSAVTGPGQHPPLLARGGAAASLSRGRPGRAAGAETRALPPVRGAALPGTARLGSVPLCAAPPGPARFGAARPGSAPRRSAPPHPAGGHCGAVAAPPSRADAGDQVCGGGRRVSAGGAAPRPPQPRTERARRRRGKGGRAGPGLGPGRSAPPAGGPAKGSEARAGLARAGPGRGRRRQRGSGPGGRAGPCAARASLPCSPHSSSTWVLPGYQTQASLGFYVCLLVVLFSCWYFAIFHCTWLITDRVLPKILMFAGFVCPFVGRSGVKCVAVSDFTMCSLSPFLLFSLGSS